VAPLAEEGAEAQQQIHQQGRPHLPAHGAGVVPEKVGQLQRLFEFLEVSAVGQNQPLRVESKPASLRK
jgi:hypothetical protein